jgi:hypothetical protein
MICPSCHTFRPANNGPCPQCHAPSPLLQAQNGNDFTQSPTGNWEGPMTSSSRGEWNNGVSTGSSQNYDNSLWAQVMAPQIMQGQGSTQPAPGSALPVPYSAGQLPVPYTIQPGLPGPTIQLGGTGGAMIPAQPAGDGPIYVPPMYTKPRAIIPPYRIISGLISFIVVIGLLCAGGIYYAKATGKLSFLRQIINPHFANITPSPAVLLPTPTVIEVPGPASKVINSATTASTIDPISGYPKNATNTFQVNQKIYLTYSVHSNTAGSIRFKWFTNSYDYYDSPPIAIPQTKNGLNGNTGEVYARPAQGMVEIYWNNQLAWQIFFVVEPIPTNTP